MEQNNKADFIEGEPETPKQLGDRGTREDEEPITSLIQKTGVQNPWREGEKTGRVQKGKPLECLGKKGEGGGKTQRAKKVQYVGKIKKVTSERDRPGEP